MIFFLLALFIICLIKIKVRPADTSLGEFMEKDQTTAINGIFVILIVLGHAYQRCTSSDLFIDTFYNTIRSFLGQFVVAPILFYSGYGIMKSVLSKDNYVKSFPKKRMFKVWYHYAIYVIIGLIVELIVGESIELVDVLIRFTSFSNWYIFASLILYLFCFISFGLIKNKKVGAWLLLGLTVLTIIVEYFLKRAYHNFNTIILFPIGALYAVYFDKINKILFNKLYKKIVLFIVSTCLFLFVGKLSGAVDVLGFDFIIYEIKMISGVIAVVSFTSMFTVKNKVLLFLGNHVFEAYVLQNIVFTVLTALSVNQYLCLYAGISVVATILLSIPFKMLLSFLDKKLIR